MADQVIVNIARPEVGIAFIAESPEAMLADRLAACQLALHGLARQVQGLHQVLGTSCPNVVEQMVASDSWPYGM